MREIPVIGNSGPVFRLRTGSDPNSGSTGHARLEAGSQGGFYVDANCLRNLAEACTEAADEIEGVTLLEADPRPQQFISVNVFVDGEKVSTDAH